MDAAVEDTGVSDASGTDTGDVRMSCTVGLPCDFDAGCAVGECIGEVNTPFGGGDDPIEGHPDGATSIPRVSWAGGYCVPRLAGGATGVGCDPRDPDDCPACAECTVLNRWPPHQSLCFDRCAPSRDDNADCRDGYRCSYLHEVCLPGCSSDEQCRIQRIDTNGDGVIESERDSLVYDSDSDAVCNRETWRCEHSGTPGAEAGDPCEMHSECEQGGTCFHGTASLPFPDGYCTRFGCHLPGVTCAGDGTCVDRGVDTPLCLAPCRVGVTDPPGDSFAPAADCRAGYRCLWDGGSDAMGGCVPGNFNGLREPNLGDACDQDADCYSPFGQGKCAVLDWSTREGYCTVVDCDAPRVPDDVCGPEAACVRSDGFAVAPTLCLRLCDAASDCAEGLGCLDHDGTPESTRVCAPACSSDADCRDGERCHMPSGEGTGICR